MNRITIEMLEAQVLRLNEDLERPVMPYCDGPDFKAQIGCFHLYSAYGSIGLVEMTTSGGGVKAIIGLTTKRDLYNRINSIILGISLSQGDN